MFRKEKKELLKGMFTCNCCGTRIRVIVVLENCVGVAVCPVCDLNMVRDKQRRWKPKVNRA